MKLDQILDTPHQWQHQDAEIRLKYIKNNSLESSILIKLANNDEDIAVRLAAIGQYWNSPIGGKKVSRW